ncbi:MAG: hypothetical protein L0215_12290 [Gemmataceae bacterium]|nr:hypothetical protein [Gemmataceae bacterium]
MAKKKEGRQRLSVVYPKHAFRPEDLLSFVELKPFTGAWKDLALSDDDLAALQVAIMLNPKGQAVVAGTGGLRKIRFAPARWKTGKSGAVRVGYVYLQEYGTVLLAIAYAKNEKGDLTPAEKKAIRDLIRKVEQEFASGTIR